MKLFWKKTGILVIALLMLCSAIGCGGKTEGVESVGDLAYYDLGDGTYGVGVAEGKEKTVSAVVVPATYREKPVVKIVRSGFADCEKLVSVALSDGMTQIDAFAFSNCYALTDVTLNQTLTTVGSYAFSGCASLKSIALPDSVTALGSYAFSFCTALESITLPASLQTLSAHTFYNCNALQTVTVPDCVTAIEKYAFLNCTALTGVSIGSGVSEIAQYAFDGCRSLSAFTVHEDNEAYRSANGILYDNPTSEIVSIPAKLAGDIVIPAGVTSIASSAFAGMDGITSITIPKSVTSIGGSAFSGCTSLAAAHFETVSGWKSDNRAIEVDELNDPATAAKYLTDNYAYEAWKRS